VASPARTGPFCSQAADKLAECFKTLLKRGEPRDMLQNTLPTDSIGA
jgi:hypothetical protein